MGGSKLIGMNLSLVSVTREGPIAIVTINRPDKRNALSRLLIRELTQAFETVAADDSRVIILTGNGPAFCAGMDLDELRQSLTAEADQVWGDAHALSALYELIFNLAKPTIAAVNGTAVAGGAGLVTVCDLAVSVPTAKFGYPEVRRGLVAAMVMPHLLRHVGERAARWLLLTGDVIDAPEAQRIGLINTVATAETYVTTAKAWANAIIAGGPKALSQTKQLLRQCGPQSVAVADLAQASAEPRLTDECHGGLRAFFEQRPAPWLPTAQNPA
jgi:methylglutaconyl-CoA hydratase